MTLTSARDVRGMLFLVFVVRPVRFHIGRIVAVLLLLWTGADIVNAQLCSADRQPFSSITDLRVSDATSQHESRTAGDDCFCCSHTVQAVTGWVSMPIFSAGEYATQLELGAHFTIHGQIYHPPQSSARL